MPDSQENEWEDLGCASEANFNIELPEVDWEAMRVAFDNLAESIRVVRPQIEERLRQLRPEFSGIHPQHYQAQASRIRETESMAVDIRHGEYPHRDGYGTYWYDPSGFHSDDSHVCFICGRPTSRIDIDFHGAFCNSEECNEVIRRDLEKLNGGPENEEV